MFFLFLWGNTTCRAGCWGGVWNGSPHWKKKELLKKLGREKRSVALLVVVFVPLASNLQKLLVRTCGSRTWLSWRSRQSWSLGAGLRAIWGESACMVICSKMWQRWTRRRRRWRRTRIRRRRQDQENSWNGENRHDKVTARNMIRQQTGETIWIMPSLNDFEAHVIIRKTSWRREERYIYIYIYIHIYAHIHIHYERCGSSCAGGLQETHVARLAFCPSAELRVTGVKGMPPKIEQRLQFLEPCFQWKEAVLLQFLHVYLLPTLFGLCRNVVKLKSCLTNLTCCNP